MQTIIEKAKLWAEVDAVQAVVIMIGSVVAAYAIEFIINRTLLVIARKTKTSLDDVAIEAMRRPIFISVILAGLAWASNVGLQVGWRSGWTAILKTIAIFVWTFAGLRIISAVLRGNLHRGGMVQQRTIPVFDIVGKVVVIGTAVYFIFLAWDIDVTAWLASAGILGIAVGFAAKDTLANLFSGIFIIADAPYKIGDFIVLDGNLRGQVTAIGMRSTRILTRDDIEITVPNAVIGASKIVNEAGGPHVKQRIRVTVSAAYGSDVDKVREVLASCPKGIAGISFDHEPQVRFREMGDSGLRFELLVWIEEPSARGQILDELHTVVYKSFYKAGIEIPFPKRDIYIKQMPSQSDNG